jgi:hypothetical protein
MNERMKQPFRFLEQQLSIAWTPEPSFASRKMSHGTWGHRNFALHEIVPSVSPTLKPRELLPYWLQYACVVKCPTRIPQAKGSRKWAIRRSTRMHIALAMRFHFCLTLLFTLVAVATTALSSSLLRSLCAGPAKRVCRHQVPAALHLQGSATVRRAIMQCSECFDYGQCLYTKHLTPPRQSHATCAHTHCSLAAFLRVYQCRANGQN